MITMYSDILKDPKMIKNYIIIISIFLILGIISELIKKLIKNKKNRKF